LHLIQQLSEIHTIIFFWKKYNSKSLVAKC